MAMTERKMRWIVRLGVLVIRALAATWRIQWPNRAPVEAIRANHRVIFSLWHGELLPLLWAHRGQRVAIVISEHKDGEIIARIAHALGYHTVRGSTTRGGGRALIGLIRAIGEGFDGAVTPDGPRGPAHVFAPGAAVAAQRSGALILPVRAACSSAWRLKSWDRFMVPKPFARVIVTYGEPTAVNATSPREAAEQAPALEALLNAVPGADP
jgi:lysophospholipid acyltransferase (LPLAT)-like uncharacterized protein